MELIPLGTNGFFPSHGRGTMSFLLCEPGRALVLDAGSGLGRLGEAAIAKRLEGVEVLDIVLTHYHLDHVIGLSYLPGVWRERRARIFAPGPPLVEGDPDSGFGRLLAPPLFPPMAQWPLEVAVHAYGCAADLAGLEWSLELRAQDHPGGSVGLRVGSSMAYITDTVCDPATVEFVRGVDLLLHEVWWSDAEFAAAPNAAGHSSTSAVAEIVRSAEVGAFAAVHHRPDRDPDRLAQHLAQVRAAVAPVQVVELVEGVAVSVGI